MGVIASYIDSDDKADVVRLISHHLPKKKNPNYKCFPVEIVPGFPSCHYAGNRTMRSDRE
jgi:hypothetical protein